MKEKIERIDIVTLFLSILMVCTFFMSNFISYKKSRVNIAESVSAKVLFGNMYWIGIIIILFFVAMSVVKQNSIVLNFLTGVLANLFLAIFVLGVALRYDALPFEHMNSSRMSFGAGYVLIIIALYGIIVTCGDHLEKRWMKAINGSMCWILITIFLVMGYLDSYAVMKEYQANKSTFMTCVKEHISTCIKSILASIVIGVPTGYWCYRNRMTDKIITFVISIFETLPMLALFAMVRIPCAALGEVFPALQSFGVGSHGISVSVIALTLYALYLIITNSRAAFSTIEKDYMETAFAMGMSPRKVFFKIQFPLALPVILAGVRLAIISTFTAASLAAYFGGGGLGRYISIGVNGMSLDAQLLAVIPIFVLTILVDLLMKAIICVIRYLVGGNRNDNTAKCI